MEDSPRTRDGRPATPRFSPASFETGSGQRRPRRQRPNTAAVVARVAAATVSSASPPRVRNARADDRDVRGLVRTAAMRNRREVRRVGLDEHAIERRERAAARTSFAHLNVTMPLNER